MCNVQSMGHARYLKNSGLDPGPFVKDWDPFPLGFTMLPANLSCKLGTCFSLVSFAAKWCGGIGKPDERYSRPRLS